MILEQCRGVHCVDLDESFPTSIYLQNLASIQPRTSLVKFARSPRTDPPGVLALARRAAPCEHRRVRGKFYPLPRVLARGDAQSDTRPCGARDPAAVLAEEGAPRASRGARARGLVERFRIEPYSDFSAK